MVIVAAQGRIALPYSGTVPRLISTAKLVRDSVGLSANSFRFYFTGCLTLLFAFPSRYLFTIGFYLYLALEDGSPRFPHSICSVVLGKSLESRTNFVYQTFTVYGVPFQTLLLSVRNPTLGSHNPPIMQALSGFRLLPFRSPLLRQSLRQRRIN